MINNVLNKKRIVMVVARQDFRDEEYFIPKNIFETEKIKVITVGVKKGEALGIYGGVCLIEKSFDEIEINDFDVLIFAGGTGALTFLTDLKAHQLIKKALEDNKIIGAICVAPAILAVAGVLAGKKATVYASNMDKTAVKILKENGAEYVEKPVVVDGNIITANGSGAARVFAETIIRALEALKG